jgi:hypothetical protein
MNDQWIEFASPAVRNRADRVLVRSSAIQGLVEDGGQCELHLSFASLSVSGTFEENAAKIRAAVPFDKE